MSARDFLLELGTEELPPKTLKRLMTALGEGVAARLDDLGLNYKTLTPYATPRRLAVLVEGLDARQPDTRTERRGPPVKIAFDDQGMPTKAAEKFLAGCGVPMDALTTLKTDKGEWLYYEGVEKGRETPELLPEVIEGALADLPIARRMRWGARREEFVRPVHWAAMLWGDTVIEATLVGVPTGRVTYGHRFHAPAAIELATAVDYVTSLESSGFVMPDFAGRRATVSAQIERTAAELGGEAVVDDALLDEVTALVEWPVPIAGQFDPRFLKLPREVLISTLKDHQRYFPLVDAGGALLPWFITIANIESRDPAAVKDGNERVVRPRLSDAEFFYSTDRATPLAARVDTLSAVVFQKALGTLKDKTDRIGALAAHIGAAIGADADAVSTAAAMCKCDLLTEMVGEFPELQGIMGRYYAAHDGHADEVAAAMAEQYLPRFAGDALPATPTGQALAIADRLDTLAGIFAIGKKPSGTRDPFGLRRAALGVLRIVIEGGLDVDLSDLIRRAAEQVHAIAKPGKKGPAYADADALRADLDAYFAERLRGYVADDDALAIGPGVFDAVLATAPPRPLDLIARLRAVSDFMQHEASEALAAANKRIANILKKTDGAPEAVNAALLNEDAERTLHAALEDARAAVPALVAERRYAEALTRLAALRDSVDGFFDDVLVMADDEAVKRNRLALLTQLRQLFLGIADFSKIQ